MEPSELPTAPPHEAQTTRDRRSRWLTIGLSVLLVAAVYLAGSPAIDAPWLQGDEHIFIVKNPQVTGAGIENDSAWRRLALIFHFPPQHDLYQPVPILTYAIEWALWGNPPVTIRRTDVLLHALNALLLWRVLGLLLRRQSFAEDARVLVLLAWALALVWALHPVLTRAYAADMGRTHLLSATFALLSLRLHLASLGPRRAYLFGLAVAALVMAMLCKVIPGWVLLVMALEVCALGWRKALRSPRIYVVGVLCAGFGALAYWTSQQAGVVEDASAGLFGGPVARSALAVWIYFRNLVAPLWLSPWYLPDPQTHWTNLLVWCGLILAVATAAHAAALSRRHDGTGIALGWAWCWALLLPAVGLFGARELAADDRYLYQPLMGILVVLGTVALRWISRLAPKAPAAAARAIVVVAVLLGAALYLWDAPHVRMYRSTLRSRDRIAKLNPGDPRALEALAQGYDFATNHALPADDLAEIPADETQYTHFLAKCITTLRGATTADNLEDYFPGPDDRAPFHRRLSHALKMTRQYQESLEQAERAHELQPTAFLTWVRLAHAYQGLRRWEEAVQAYQRCEELLPAVPKTRAIHFTDFGYLWLFELDQAREAYPKFQAAVATGQAPTLAMIGLARCELRVGDGARGLKIISRVLDDDPQNALAGLVLAEYHLRSHHWGQAFNIYANLIAAYPSVYHHSAWYYEALRGFQAVCGQIGRWRDAALAWDVAVRLHPDNREFRSFLVWSLACSGDEEALAWAEDLLSEDPDNPLACLARMLTALRAGQVGDAVEWVRRARLGRPIPKGREFERAAAALKTMAAQGQLPAESAIVAGAIYATGGQREPARGVLSEYLDQQPESVWTGLVEHLLEGDEAVPTSQRLRRQGE